MKKKNNGKTILKSILKFIITLGILYFNSKRKEKEAKKFNEKNINGKDMEEAK